MVFKISQKILKHFRAGFLLLIITLLITSCSEKQKPNILWIISEDTSPDLSCFGNTVVNTPNLDRLAGEGIRFENAYSTSPVCSPSRSAFMTGMYQTTIGVHQHRTRFFNPLPKPVEVVTEYFRRAGYFVSNGKGTDTIQPGKNDWNFKVNDEAFDGTDWSQRDPGQPFFAQLNFSLTHRPFKRDTVNPINPEKVFIPPYYPDHPITRRDWADYLESLQVLDRQIGQVLKRLDDDGLSDNTIVFYFGDHGRPHVRGKQWLYEGGIRVPLIVRWPGHLESGTISSDLVSLIDLAPTSLSLAGIEVPAHLQGNIFLGSGQKKRVYIFSARDRCDGTIDRIRCVRSKQYKYIRNYFPERPYTQFSGYKKWRYPVLTLMNILAKEDKLTPEQSHFMAPQRPNEELYDLMSDPFELKNLASQAEFNPILVEMSQELDSWITETKDKGEIPEDPEEQKYSRDMMYRKYAKRMTEQGVSPEISDEDYLEFWRDKLF